MGLRASTNAPDVDFHAVGRIFAGQMMTRSMNAELTRLNGNEIERAQVITFVNQVNQGAVLPACVLECMECSLAEMIEMIPDDEDGDSLISVDQQTQTQTLLPLPTNSLQPLAGAAAAAVPVRPHSSPRFAQLRAYLDTSLAAGALSRAASQVMGGTAGPGYMYMWHFVDASGAHAPPNHYKIGQTIAGRKHPRTNSEWAERVREAINVDKMKKAKWTFVIDRVWQFDVDALRVESYTHGLLESQGYPRAYKTSKTQAGGGKYMMSGATEVFSLKPTSAGKWNNKPFASAIAYVDSLIMDAADLQVSPAKATMKYTWKLGTLAGKVVRKSKQTKKNQPLVVFKADTPTVVCGAATTVATLATALGAPAVCDNTYTK